MKNRVLLWTFGVVLVSAPASYGGTVAIEIPWSCPAPKGLTYTNPSELVIRAENGDPPKVDVSELDGLLSKLRIEHPDLDFSQCVEKFVSAAQSKVFKKLTGKKNKALRDLAFSKLYASSSKYFQETSAAQVPYFEPMSSAAVPLSKSDLAGCGSKLGPEHLDRSFVESLGQNTKKFSKTCKNQIAGRYAQLLQEAQCNERVITGGPECETRRRAVLAALTSLHDQGFAPYLKDADIQQAAKGCDPFSAFMALNLKMYRFIENLSPITNCVQLEAGDPEAMIDGDTGTGFDVSYGLKRESNGDYVATLNLQFQGDKNSKWRAIAQKCFDQVNQKGWLSGPPPKRNKIKLAIGDGPKATKVWVEESDDGRSRASAWRPVLADENECPTVIHESLHLLGLVDDYPEPAMGFVPYDGGLELVDDTRGPRAFNCRVPIAVDSVMSNQYLAFGMVENDLVTVSFCTCVPSPGTSGPGTREKVDACIKSLKPGQACLPPARIDESVTRRSNTPSESVPYLYVLGTTPYDGTTRSSLIYPAQFNALTQPGCAAQNADYYVAALESYRTSRDAGNTSSCGKVFSSSLTLRNPWGDDHGAGKP